MNDDREFGWGIAATGSMARTLADVIVAEPGMRVAAVGSRDPERARAFAAETESGAGTGAVQAYGSYAELVDDPAVDAVYIATPHAQHRHVAELAFAAGKAVLCEKPLAATCADAEAIVEQARAAGLFLMEAMWMRFNPVIRRAREIVASGTIGDVRSITASFGFPAPFDPAHRLWDPAQGGGALLDLGIYPVALAHLFLGTPERVEVTGSLASSGVDAEAELSMSWPGGVRATLETSLLNLQPMAGQITGTLGRVDFDPPFHATSRLSVHVGTGTDTNTEAEADTQTEEFTAEGPREALAAELREVRDLVRAGRTESPVVPLDDTLAVLRLLEDARKSLGAVDFT
ncbi:Gfo/Idh/MocA family protein [Yinghuangia sp. YIM S09857]|uniref:Gfo/Idh/MocA family protein n=1 Tax=Yinghuangia sp. YIM S09857 TaxID=3436929 RepID=UPI003F52CE75